MAKLSELKKVELLEAAITANDIETVRALYAEHGNFEFTPRALSLACRNGTPELVRVLCENDATFEYEYTPALAKKYDCKIATSNRDSYPKNYNRSIVVGRASKVAPSDPVAPGEMRRANLAVLWEYRDKVGLDAQEVLFHALVWQDDDLVQGLKDLGVNTLSPYRADMAAGRLPHNQLNSLGRYDRSFFSGAFHRDPMMVADFVVGIVNALGGEPLHLFKSDVTEYDFQESKDVLISKLCSEAVFLTLAQHTDFGTVIKKRDILYALVEENNAAGLAWALEQGWAEEKDEKALLEYAQKQENVAAPMMALLLNRNKLADSPADTLSLSVTPSAAELKKIWATKKLEDGTLMITSYKGEALDVVIPDKIGKNPVTALAPDVFNPKASRVTREQAEIRQNLHSVEVPGSVSIIPEKLFGSIYGSSHWTLPNLKRVVLGEGVREIGYGAFMGCTGLEEVVFPQSLTTLEYGVFYNCTALQAAHLPQGVTKIGPCAFYNCTSLKELTLPKSAALETNSFSNCPGLQDAQKMVILGNILYNYYGTMPNVMVPEGVTAIAGNAFSGNTAIEEITLPQGLKIIDESAFQKCTALRRLEIPQGVEELSAFVLEECTALESVTIPASLKKICFRALAGCAALTSIMLPMGVEEIHSEAFAKCSALQKIYIPESIKSIGDRFHKEFWCCNQLVIHGTPDSYAEAYAKKNNISFVAE